MTDSRRGRGQRASGGGGRSGDPLLARAAAELRSEGRDDAAVASIVAAVRREALRERNRATPVAADSVPAAAPVSRPRLLSLSPFAALAAAVIVFVVGVAAGASLLRPDVRQRDGRIATGAIATAASSDLQRVEFVFVAPRASRVSLVGEFNGWDAAATPMRPTASGTWSVSVPLEAGRHVYAFVVDDSTWVPDPQAPLSPERWYGERNSVVVVPGEPRT